MFESKYQCECDYEDCHKTFDSDEDWETASELAVELEFGLRVLHPNCLYLSKYEIVKQTEQYVIARVKEIKSK